MGREFALNAVIPKVELALVSEINDKASIETGVNQLMGLLSEELEGNTMAVIGKEQIGDATAHTLTIAMIGVKLTIAINDKFVLVGTFDYVKEILNTAKADSIATNPAIKEMLDNNQNLTKMSYLDVQAVMGKAEALLNNTKMLMAGPLGDKVKHINVIEQKLVKPIINVFKMANKFTSVAYLTEDGVVQESTCTRK